MRVCGVRALPGCLTAANLLQFELVRGPDLLDYIKGCHNKVPEQLGLHYFRQLLSAVSHMHQQGTSCGNSKSPSCRLG